VSDHNDLEEALLILRGASSLQPERRHLVALNDSREHWRRCASAQDPVLARALARLRQPEPQRRAS
jgi:hypothetical protein